MSDEPIISVSGLRGFVGSQLTPVVAAKYVAAYCSQLPETGLVIVSRDGRGSGEIFAKSVAATIQASGLDCVDVGVLATPTLGVLIRSESAVAGIQISASHNPIEYNGLKLFNSDGRVIPAAPGDKVLRAYRDSLSRFVDVHGVGSTVAIDTPEQSHLEAILRIVDVDLIRSKRFSIFVDSNRGAGGKLARRLLESLGCTVHIAGEKPDGKFEHTPEPTAENLANIAKQIAEGDFQIGFCQDPDADRLALIDENGVYIGEEKTVAICADFVLNQTPGPLVVNCATSSMNQSVAEKHNCKFMRSKVGEANVVDLMLEQNAVFGGEGNGGPIDPRIGLVRDSFVGMALTLNSMAATDQPLSQISAELPKFEMIKDKMSMEPSKLTACIDQLREKMDADEVDQSDGVRLTFEDGWLLLRGSNTEPIVRLIAEFGDSKHAESRIAEAKAIINAS